VAVAVAEGGLSLLISVLQLQEGEFHEFEFVHRELDFGLNFEMKRRLR
jgi:hypothetical protein